MDLFTNDHITDYDAYEKTTYATTQKAGENAPGLEVVAKTIFKAANDNSFRLRYAVGNQLPVLLLLRRLWPNNAFFALVRNTVEKGFRPQMA